MVEIWLRVTTERIEGKTMSTELVADQLVDLLEGEDLQVEDSEYEVIEVEATAPKQRGSGATPELGDLLLGLADAYFAAWPVHIDLTEDHSDPDLVRADLTGDERRLDSAISRVLSASGGLVQQAKMRRFRREKGQGRGIRQ